MAATATGSAAPSEKQRIIACFPLGAPLREIIRGVILEVVRFERGDIGAAARNLSRF